MGATDLSGLLADHGIRVRRRAPGVWVKATCPKCEGGKTREESLSVRIDDDSNGAIWKCHRGTCGWEGNGRIVGAGRADGAEGRPQRPERAVQPPPPHPPAVVTNRPKAFYKFFADRGITEETVDLFGCYIAKRWFPKHADLPEGEHPAIVFPYVFGGRAVNRKYRSTRKMFMQERDALPTLFNVDAIDAADPQIVVWVEGELDVMACHEAGYPQSITLPNGAPARLRDEDDPAREHDERFAPLRTHADLLSKVKKFILAGDMDGPGQVLREELARRLGRHRCWIVTWPEGCKDAGDVLQAHGAERVQECIEAATPYPIRGVHYIQPGTLEGYRDEVPPPLLTTGLHSLDRVLKLPSDGRLIVTTGYPGSGKSSLIRYLMVHTALEHDRRWMVFSPEMSPWKRFASTIAEVRIGEPFRDRHGHRAMPREAIRAVERWMAGRFVFLASDAEDEAPTVEWILERTRMEVIRAGVTDLLIDPWNQVSHDFGRMNETQYIERQLQIVAGFGQRHGVNTWIVAHPIKPRDQKSGDDGPPPPTLYDIAGSATWFNRCDIGLVVHRPPGKHTEIHIRKARFDEYGEKGGLALAEYEKWSGRFLTPHSELYTEEERG
jgi:twinkle protein